MADQVGIYHWKWEEDHASPSLIGLITLGDDGSLTTDTPSLQSIIDVTLHRNNGDARKSMEQIRGFDNGYSWAQPAG